MSHHLVRGFAIVTEASNILTGQTLRLPLQRLRLLSSTRQLSSSVPVWGCRRVRSQSISNVGRFEEVSVPTCRQMTWTYEGVRVRCVFFKWLANIWSILDTVVDRRVASLVSLEAEQVWALPMCGSAMPRRFWRIVRDNMDPLGPDWPSDMRGSSDFRSWEAQRSCR